MAKKIITISLWLILSLLFSSKTSFSQKMSNSEIKPLLDSALFFLNNNEKLSFLYLNKAMDLASASGDDEGLIEIYTVFSDIFERNKNVNKAQMFYLKKYTLLQELYEKNPSPQTISNLLETIRKLAVTYEKQNEISIAIDFYDKARKIAIKENLTTDLVSFQVLIGNCYLYVANYEKAEEKYLVALELSEQLNNDSLICKVKILQGTLLYNKSNYKEALTSFLEALSIAENLENKKFESVCNIGISKIFFDLRMYEKALEYNKKSFPVNKSIENSVTIGISYLRQADIYYQLNNYEKAINYYDKSIVFLSSETHEHWLAFTFTGMGKTYLKLNKPEKAYQNIIKGLSIRKNIKRKRDLAESYIALGEYYLFISNSDQAKAFLTKGFNFAKEIGNTVYMEEASQELSRLYAKEKNFELAYKYSEISNSLTDSLMIKEKIELATKTEIEYHNQQELKTKENQILARKKYNTLLYFTLVALLIFIGVIAVIFSFLLNSRKKLIKQKLKTEKQNRVIKEQYKKFKELSIVASHTDNAIIIADKNGKIDWVNNAFVRIHNKDLKKLEAEKKCFIAKLANSPEVDKRINYCITNRKTVKYEYSFKLIEQKIWLQTTLTPFVENGEITKLIAVESDITEQKTANKKINAQKKELENQANMMKVYNSELKAQKIAIFEQNEELRQHHEELQANAEMLKKANQDLRRLSLIAHKTDNTIYLLDTAGDFIWVNDAFERNTGYRLNEFVAEKSKNLITASTNPDIENIFMEFLQTKKTVTYTSQLKTKNGKKIWLQTSLTPILKNDEIIEIIAIDTDITKIKEAEEKIFEQNSEIKSSIHYAHRIQKALLPMPIFIQALFENYFILNKPRDIVSGDFYWVAHRNGKSIVVVADSTGHGIPGAFMSVLGMMSFNTVINRVTEVKADIIMNKMKQLIIRMLHQRGKHDEASDGMDAAICVFDFENNLLEYAGANSPIYIVRKNSQNLQSETKRIRPDKISLDYNPLRGETFTSHLFNIKKGDKIYMTSDGYTDQFGGRNGKKFMRKKFEKLLEVIFNRKMYEQKAILSKAHDDWRKNHSQVDDILVVGIEV